MKPEMGKRLKSLEEENARLKKIVAERTLDCEIPKKAAKGNWEPLNVVGARYPPCVAVWAQKEPRSVVPVEFLDSTQYLTISVASCGR